VWVTRLSKRAGLGAFYAALITGRPGFAVLKTTSGGSHFTSWIWIFYNFQLFLSGIHGFPTGSIFEILIFAVGVPFFTLMGILIKQNGMSDDPYSADNIRGNWLVQEFRFIAQSPIPDTNDTRFKKWRVNQRFPIGKFR
jgi:hypothetical protein